MCWWQRPAAMSWRQCGAGGCYRLYWSGNPHILRLCGLTDHRVLLGCALAGASALLLADVVARLALACRRAAYWRGRLATLGAPVFIWLLLKAGR
ncbi:iron chelate uptake ABC transporter family permease subunit [Escherichia coli]